MNGPVHTPAAQQGLVGRIDDRIDSQLGDIAWTTVIMILIAKKVSGKLCRKAH